MVDIHLRAGDLGGVAADEVEHRLFRSQLADGRQYAKGIAGQEYDILRIASHRVRSAVLDVLDND